MNNKDLIAFLELAECLHFARAASRLHMSAPTLSRRIQQLEKELGTELFIRDQRSVELTPAGCSFRAYAQKNLQQWDELQQSLRSDQQLLSGEVSLFCSVTASYQLLSSLLPDFRRKYPGIEIRLHTGDQAESIRRVMNSEEDIAIAANPAFYSSAGLPPRLAFMPITQTELVLIAPAMESGFSDLLAEPLSNLEQLPFIFPETGVTRKALDKWLLDLQVQPQMLSEVAGHEAIVAMVALGLGIALVPELVLENSPARHRVIALNVNQPVETLEVGLCCHKRKLANPLLKAFWDTAKDAFQHAVD